MSKRNIAYIKPEDPKFLRLLKEQVGYSDSNPKFEKFDNDAQDFAEDEESERPQVVVLKPGDLTAEEAAAEEENIIKEQLETKADLTQRVIFTTNKNKPLDTAKKRTTDSNDKDKSMKKSKKETSRPILSFDVNDEEDV